MAVDMQVHFVLHIRIYDYIEKLSTSVITLSFE